VKISELIAEYGDDKVEFQNLDQCVRSLDYHHKNGTTVTFGTAANVDLSKGTEKLGLVIWLDRDRVAEIISKSKEASRG
jgi:hypothetical protein